MQEIKRMSTEVLNKQDFLLAEKHLNHSTPIHWHEFYEIEYFLEGHGTAFINQKPYEIHPGTLLFLTPTDFEEIPDWGEGRLINVGKVRGRDASLKELVTHMKETMTEDPADATVFISHGDCEEDAKKTADYVKEMTGADVQIINCLGSVIGAHAGPGTIALFFLGSER